MRFNPFRVRLLGNEADDLCGIGLAPVAGNAGPSRLKKLQMVRGTRGNTEVLTYFRLNYVPMRELLPIAIESVELQTLLLAPRGLV